MDSYGGDYSKEPCEHCGRRDDDGHSCQNFRDQLKWALTVISKAVEKGVALPDFSPERMNEALAVYHNNKWRDRKFVRF